MSVIHVLSAEIAGRIAAGEVIERPASVVKELVENAIDAGATRIRVQIEQGGQRLIQVTDNGCGMDRADALMCLEAHATSKLTKDGDVGQIMTLGFRGEAIPSIASVSRFQLQTRRKEDDIGTEVIVDNGIINNVTDCGCAPGTNVKVGYLFGNLPARRKFMKGPETEDGYIEEMILMLALTRPDIAFTLSLNGREAIRTTVSNDIASRVMMLLGRDAFAAMLPVNYEESGISVHGYVSKPGFTRSSRRDQRMIINGRAAAAETLYFAIREAYDTLILKGRYPGTVLYLTVPPAMVDVNVHPAKREVRFSDARLIGGVVAAAIRRALRQMPGMGLETTPVTRPGGYTPAPFVPQPQQTELPLSEVPVSNPAAEASVPISSATPSVVPVHEQPSMPSKPSAAVSPVEAPPAAVPSSVAPPAAVPSSVASPAAVPQSVASPAAVPSSVAPPAAVPSSVAPPAAVPRADFPQAAVSSKTAQQGLGHQDIPKPTTVLNGVHVPPQTAVQPSIPNLIPPPDAMIKPSPVPQPTKPQPLPQPPPVANTSAAKGRPNMQMSICGRLGKRYILAQGADGLIIIDIRAAHQRILFERLLVNLKNRKVQRQQLLLPVTVNLSNEESRFLKTQLEQFDAIGFSIEPFGGTTYIITAVPSAYPDEDLGKAIRDILEDLRVNRSVNSSNAIHLAQLACRHAISLKETLTDDEVRKILADLAAVEMPYADPAGNPTMVHVTYAELEKRFKQ